MSSLLDQFFYSFKQLAARVSARLDLTQEVG